MKTFKRFALGSTIVTYVLIFVGGLVRVSGAGLGCPDWPKCFGRWIPPTRMDQLPADIDPNLFNFTLAWIEYINRLIGVFVGLMIAVTAVLALVNMRRYPKIVIPSVLAALLVAFQGWQGSQVVSSALEPFILTIHLGIALVIVSLLIYATYQAYALDAGERWVRIHDVTAKRLTVGLWILTLIQIVFGTQMRSALQTLQEQFPMAHELEWLAKVGPVHNLHVLLGIIVLVLAVYLTFRLSGRPPMVRNLAFVISGMMVIQLIVGFLLIGIGLPGLLQLLHLWLASLCIGAVLILYSTFE